MWYARSPDPKPHQGREWQICGPNFSRTKTRKLSPSKRAIYVQKSIAACSPCAGLAAASAAFIALDASRQASSTAASPKSAGGSRKVCTRTTCCMSERRVDLPGGTDRRTRGGQGELTNKQPRAQQGGTRQKEERGEDRRRGARHNPSTTSSHTYARRARTVCTFASCMFASRGGRKQDVHDKVEYTQGWLQAET